MKLDAKKVTVLSFIVCILLAASGADAWWIFGKGDKAAKPVSKSPVQSQAAPTVGEAPAAPSSSATLKQPSMTLQHLPFQAKPGFGLIMLKSGGFPPGLANDRQRAEMTQKFWDVYKLSAGILNIISNPDFQSFTGQDLKNPMSRIRILIDSLAMNCEEPGSTPAAVRICGGLQKYVSLLNELNGITALNEVYEQPCTDDSIRYSLVPPLNCYSEYVNEHIAPFIGRFQTLILWGDPSAPGYTRPADFGACHLNVEAFDRASQNVLCTEVCMEGVHIIGETGTGCDCTWRNAFDRRLVPILEAYREMGRTFVMYLSGNGTGYSGWDPADPANAPPSPTIIE